jgi:uncharacterized protein YndB with AHSA1/START domain
VSESYGAVVPTSWDAAVFVAAPRAKVFDYLADPRHRPEWQASLERVELLDEGAPRVGMRWIDHLKVGPPFELQIIGMESDDLWAEMGRVGPLRAFVTLLFQDETRNGVDGTCVRIVARVRGHRLAKPLGWLATGVMGALVRVDVPRLARVVEQQT